MTGNAFALNKEGDAMTYLDRIRTTADPEVLEQTYRSALKSGEDEAFIGAVETAYAERPDNPLLGARH
jgi:hypothetical protein